MRIHLEMGSLKDPGHHYGPFHLYRSLFPRIKPFDESRGEVALERGAVLIRVIHIEQQGIDPTSHKVHFRHTHHASFFCILRGAVYLLRAQTVRPHRRGPYPTVRPHRPTGTRHPSSPHNVTAQGAVVCQEREQGRQAQARDRPPPATPPPRPLPPPAQTCQPACIRCQTSCGESW